ncbi:MAG: hypothetical protein ACPLX8_02435 [Nanopusillaceae archaeon]
MSSFYISPFPYVNKPDPDDVVSNNIYYQLTNLKMKLYALNQQITEAFDIIEDLMNTSGIVNSTMLSYLNNSVAQLNSFIDQPLLTSSNTTFQSVTITGNSTSPNSAITLSQLQSMTKYIFNGFGNNFIIDHNLNSTLINVTCYDITNNITIIPDSIKIISENTIEISLGLPTNVSILISI